MRRSRRRGRRATRSTAARSKVRRTFTTSRRTSTPIAEAAAASRCAPAICASRNSDSIRLRNARRTSALSARRGCDEPVQRGDSGWLSAGNSVTIARFALRYPPTRTKKTNEDKWGTDSLRACDIGVCRRLRQEKQGETNEASSILSALDRHRRTHHVVRRRRDRGG